MIPVCGYRSLVEEAKLWRQSRSTAEILEKIAQLKSDNCDYLAGILESVGPCNGPWATNTIPGLSWHNWRQAIDFAWEDKGFIDWNGDSDAYKTLADEAIKLGLTPGYYFHKRDAGHIQFNAKEVPEVYTLQDVNDHFKGLDKC